MKMNEKCELVFKIICESAIKSDDWYTIGVDIGMHSGEERTKIINYLSTYGYISKVDYHGKTSLSCKVTEKGLDYYNNVLLKSGDS